MNCSNPSWTFPCPAIAKGIPMKLAKFALVCAVALVPMTAIAKSALMSDVYGQDVYDKGENKIGKVDNLQVDESGKITNAIVGVGGFLGIGEKDVAVPYSEIKWTTKNDKTWMVLDHTKDQLKAAPAVDSKGNPKK